jgi:hypothetical protein
VGKPVILGCFFEGGNSNPSYLAVFLKVAIKTLKVAKKLLKVAIQNTSNLAVFFEGGPQTLKVAQKFNTRRAIWNLEKRAATASKRYGLPDFAGSPLPDGRGATLIRAFQRAASACTAACRTRLHVAILDLLFFVLDDLRPVCRSYSRTLMQSRGIRQGMRFIYYIYVRENRQVQKHGEFGNRQSPRFARARVNFYFSAAPLRGADDHARQPAQAKA